MGSPQATTLDADLFTVSKAFGAALVILGPVSHHRGKLSHLQ